MLPFLSRNRKAPIFAFFKNLAFRLQNHRFSQQSRSSGPQNPQFCPASRTPITTPQAVLRLVQSPPPPKGVHPVSPQGRAPRVPSRACTRHLLSHSRPTGSPAGLLSHSPASSLTPRPPQAHPHSYSPRPPKGNIVTVTKWRDHTCYFRSSWHLGSTHTSTLRLPLSSPATSARASISHSLLSSPRTLRRPLPWPPYLRSSPPAETRRKKTVKCFGCIIGIS